MSIVTTEDHGPVRHVVLNRPEKRNALDTAMVRAIGAALAGAAADTTVRCVVIRGEGKVFSSGMDINELAQLARTPERLRDLRGEFLAAWNRAEEMTKPTIAQIHGACLGGAMELALACDLRVIADDARMGLPEVKLGLVPDLGGSSRLPAVVGLGRAKELIMTGREVDAAEAHRIGLVNRVAPPGGLAAATEELTGELLAAFEIPVGRAKRIMDAAARPALSAALELEVTAQEVCVASLAAAIKAGGGPDGEDGSAGSR